MKKLLTTVLNESLDMVIYYYSICMDIIIQIKVQPETRKLLCVTPFVSTMVTPTRERARNKAVACDPNKIRKESGKWTR